MAPSASEAVKRRAQCGGSHMSTEASRGAQSMLSHLAKQAAAASRIGGIVAPTGEKMKRIGIVTGASSGLGWEFALQLDTQRKLDEIWLVARREDKLQELASLLKHSTPIVITLDLSTKAGCDEIATRLKNTEAELAVFVNNAGFGTYGPFLETAREKQLELVDLNMRALTDLSWTALSQMKAGAVLINVSSLAAFMPLGNFAVYAASKAFVLSLSMALAAENEHRGITVVALCPGSTRTEFGMVASGGARKEHLRGKSAEAVVAHCLKNASAKRWQAVYAADWKIIAFLSRFFGRKLIARLTFRFAKRPHIKGE